MTIKAWLARVARFRLFGLRAALPASKEQDSAAIRRSLSHRLSPHLLRDIGAGEE
jgi:hypothetical protein